MVRQMPGITAREDSVNLCYIKCIWSNLDLSLFPADGNYLLTCGSDKSLKLWSVSRGTLLKAYCGHGYEVLDADGWVYTLLMLSVGISVLSVHSSSSPLPLCCIDLTTTARSVPAVQTRRWSYGMWHQDKWPANWEATPEWVNNPCGHTVL